MTLVSELRHWIGQSRERLEENSVSITDKLPAREDHKQDKGCIGLSKNHIIISFTAWDRQPIPIELIVYNAHTDKTIIMKDYEAQSIKEVLDEINRITSQVVLGKYDDMKPDPELSIT